MLKTENEKPCFHAPTCASTVRSRITFKVSLLKFMSSLVFRYSRWPSHNRNSGDGHHGQNRSSIGTAELPDKGGLSCAVATEQKKTPRFMEICLGQRAGTRIFITSETSLDACNQKSVVGMLKFESSVTEKILANPTNPEKSPSDSWEGSQAPTSTKSSHNKFPEHKTSGGSLQFPKNKVPQGAGLKFQKVPNTRFLNTTNQKVQSISHAYSQVKVDLNFPNFV